MHNDALRVPNTSGLEPEDAKELIRGLVRERRSQRSAAEREKAAQALAEHAVQAVGDAQCVSVYVSRPTEPSTYPLLEALAARGIRTLLPVLGPGLNRAWAEFAGLDDLEERAPGRPPEPSGPALPAEAITEAEVVLTPALAVDVLGNRLGQGGGWYDRVLKTARPGTPAFAMVFDEELVGDRLLPRTDLDVPVDAVITPTHWFLLDGSAFRTEGLARQGLGQAGSTATRV
ncbi:5-formyltetrahydrofolate cyclo-ligase [Georgenia sp. 10Sc9-8]|uniref:5-formyltetrahydrofolate cyclo-ligase n=1 Tax=Georgenia halotolerans TaxID=3028317 RepID=A0ABT5U187_9MICO|nr:5-formyltetrahydrofolate cyclo-ligase [Georgenia halotolerans]